MSVLSGSAEKRKKKKKKRLQLPASIEGEVKYYTRLLKCGNADMLSTRSDMCVVLHRVGHHSGVALCVWFSL